jgi:hypothetical protein
MFGSTTFNKVYLKNEEYEAELKKEVANLESKLKEQFVLSHQV